MTSSEACLSSEARIQEVSSSVPSYPIHQTRYNSLQAQHRLSILESRISEISNSGSLSTMMAGGGAGLNRGLGLGGWVPTWKHGTLGVWLGGCQGAIE